jgi:hypothetical protein
MAYFPSMNDTFTNVNSENWTGNQAQYYDNIILSACYGEGSISSIEIEAVAESIGDPSPSNNHDGRYQISVLTGGRSAEVNETDPRLIQAGFLSTNINFTASLSFWCQKLTPGPQSVSSSCIPFKYGDKAYAI